MSLLNFALYGDKDPKKKKLNLTPQYRTAAELAGSSTYTVPADNTYVYRPAPVPQRTIADYAPPPKYWDAQGRIHTAYTGKTATREDIGRNLKIEEQIKSDNELKALGDLATFAGRTLLEPLDWGLSAIEYARGDISGTDMALSMLPFVSGGLLGLSRFGNRVRNMFKFNDIVPEFKTLSGVDYSPMLKDKAATDRIINNLRMSNPDAVWQLRDSIREVNGIDNSFSPTPTNLVPITLPRRDEVLSLIDIRNGIKNEFLDAIENSRPSRNGLASLDNLPRVNNIDGILGRMLNDSRFDYDRLRGDFLRYYTDEIRDRVKDRFGLWNGGADWFGPNFMEEQIWNSYRNILGRTGNAPIGADFGLVNDTNRSIMMRGAELEWALAQRRAAEQLPQPPQLIRIPTLATEPPQNTISNVGRTQPRRFSLGNTPTLNIRGRMSLLGNTPEIKFANEYADLFNEHLSKRGLGNYFITPSDVYRDTIKMSLSTPTDFSFGSWTMGLNDKAIEKIYSRDFSVPDFPHGAVDPYQEIPVLTMRNTSYANLPPKSGLYSQEFMDKVKNGFGIRVGAGRNSQTRNSQYIGNPDKLGSEDIWRDKFVHGRAYVPNNGANGFTEAISYAVLPPFLLRALQREKDDNTR